MVFTSHDFQPKRLENETHDEGKIVEEVKQSKILNITIEKVAVNAKQFIEQKGETAASDSETNAEDSDENLSLNLLDL